MTISYASLFNSGRTSITSASLLEKMVSLQNTGSTTGLSVSSTNPVSELETAQKNEASSLSIISDKYSVKTTLSQFEAAIKGASSAQDLLKNKAFLKVLLTASGLESYGSYTALVQQILNSDPNNPNALVYNVPDSQAWLNVVNTYQFYSGNGLSVIQNKKTIATLSAAYKNQYWLNSIATAHPALANAIAFTEQAKNITSINDILGDKLFFQVVTTAYGIPSSILNQPESVQRSLLASKVNVQNFQNPTYVQQFAERYLMMASLAGSSENSSSQSFLSLAVRQQGILV